MPAVLPPSITDSAPVTKEDSSPARYRTSSPTSSGWPTRSSATCDVLGTRPYVMGVKMKPGCTPVCSRRRHSTRPVDVRFSMLRTVRH